MKILISAGDPSGDYLGSLLIGAIKSKYPQAQVWALGGGCLKEKCDYFLENLCAQGLMGWFQPMKRLPYLLKLSQKVKNALTENRFDLFIPVDFYGLNIRFARLAKENNVPVCYYVSPQIWASRAGRLKRIKKFVDKILCLFPFEEAFYKKHAVNGVFVGHPLYPLLKKETPVETKNATKENRQIGLLPGSRPQEITRHLPVLLESWKHLRVKNPSAEAILYTRKDLGHLYPPAESLRDLGIKALQGPAFESRRELSLAITASGMACLENMILGVPMVAFYAVNPAWLYRLLTYIVQTPYIAMPNILAGQAIVQEITWGLTQANLAAGAQRLAAAAGSLLDNKTALLRQKETLLTTAKRLLPKEGEPLDCASREIEKMLGVSAQKEASLAR